MRAEEADVGVAGGDVRIARVDDERNAERFPAAAGQFGTVCGRGGRQFVAGDVRKSHAGFFKNGAFAEDASATAAAFGARPMIGNEIGRSVFGRELAADVILQREQVGFYGGEIGGDWHAAFS